MSSISSETAQPEVLSLNPGLRRAEELMAENEFSVEKFFLAGKHFKNFVGELGEHAIEREDFLIQLALGAISQTHVMALGHPGTMKTLLGKLFYGRILDTDGEPSLYAKQYAQDMRSSEILGPLVPDFDERGVMRGIVRKYEGGVSPFLFGLHDEFLDAPPGAVRTTNSVLQDGVILDGAIEMPTNMVSSLATTNRTFEDLRNQFGNALDAVFDRFTWYYWTTKRFMKPGSRTKAIQMDHSRRIRKVVSGNMGMKVPPLMTSEIAQIWHAFRIVQRRIENEPGLFELMSQVYERYHTLIDEIEDHEFAGMRRSRMDSPRTSTLFNVALPAIAVLRHIERPDTPLAVLPEDFERMRLAMMMRGPLLSSVADDTQFGNEEDPKVIGRLRHEDDAFTRAREEFVAPYERTRRATLSPPGSSTAAHLEAQLNGLLDTLKGDLNDQHLIEADFARMERLLAEFERASTIMPDGEKRYYQMAAVCLRYLQKAMRTIGPQAIIAAFGTAKLAQHIEKNKETGRGQHIALAFEQLRSAVEATYRANIGQMSSMADLENTMGAIAFSGDLLGEETALLMLEAVRTRACEVAGLSDYAQRESQGRPMAQILKEMDMLHAMAEELKKPDAHGKTRYEALRNWKTKSLELIAIFLRRTKEELNARTNDPAAVHEFLQAANSVIRRFKQDVQSMSLPHATCGSLPEELRDRHLGKLQNDLMQQNPGVEIIGHEIIQEPDQDHCTIRWIQNRREKRAVNPQEFKDAYESFVVSTLPLGPQQYEELIAIPEIEQIAAQILLEFQEYLGDQFQPEHEKGMKRRIAASIVKAYQLQKDVRLVCAFNVGNLRHTGWIISEAEVTQALNREHVQRTQKSQYALDYMRQIGWDDSNRNSETMLHLLTQDPGAPNLEIEVDQIERDDHMLVLQEVIDELQHSMQPTWQPLEDEIAQLKKEIEGKASEIYSAQQNARFQTLMLASGFPHTLPELTAKYQGILSDPAAATVTSGPNFSELTIRVQSNTELMNRLSDDLARCIEQLPWDPTKTASENLLAPLEDSLTQLKAAGCDETELRGVAAPAVVAKIKAAYAEDLTKLTEGQAAIDSLPAVAQSMELIQKLRDIAKNSGKFGRFDATEVADLEAADEKFEANGALKNDVLKSVAETRAEFFDGLIGAFIETLEGLELPQFNFKMNDVQASLTATNAADVQKFLSDEKLFTTVDKIIDRAGIDCGIMKNYVDASRADALAAHRASINQLRHKYQQARQAFEVI